MSDAAGRLAGDRCTDRSDALLAATGRREADARIGQGNASSGVFLVPALAPGLAFPQSDCGWRGGR